MSDRELLELAAKSAEIEIKWCEKIAEYRRQEYPHITNDWVTWNPLTDDGEALRLAVKLGMEISIDLASEVAPATVWAMAYADNGIGASNYLGKDPYAATRRAIVRAAAEIGNTMDSTTPATLPASTVAVR